MGCNMTSLRITSNGTLLAYSTVLAYGYLLKGGGVYKDRYLSLVYIYLVK